RPMTTTIFPYTTLFRSPTLKDVNLEIEKGDFLAIVGNNGCGKSTLCKVMNGLIPHFITGDFQGEVLVGGISTLEADIGTLAQKRSEEHTSELQSRFDLV